MCEAHSSPHHRRKMLRVCVSKQPGLVGPVYRAPITGPVCPMFTVTSGILLLIGAAAVSGATLSRGATIILVLATISITALDATCRVLSESESEAKTIDNAVIALLIIEILLLAGILAGNYMTARMHSSYLTALFVRMNK